MKMLNSEVDVSYHFVPARTIVRVLHKPTGLFAESSEGVTFRADLIEATRLLEEKLDQLAIQQAEAPAIEPAPAQVALMVDRLGNVVEEGDTIQHPDGGETATVVLDAKREGSGQWRAVYANGESLWLGNQLYRGMAVKVSPVALAAPQPSEPTPAPTEAKGQALTDALTSFVAITPRPYGTVGTRDIDIGAWNRAHEAARALLAANRAAQPDESGG